jgi:hypothetical protein
VSEQLEAIARSSDRHAGIAELGDACVTCRLVTLCTIAVMGAVVSVRYGDHVLTARA